MVVLEKLMIYKNSDNVDSTSTPNGSYMTEEDATGYFQPLAEEKWMRITDSHCPEDKMSRDEAAGRALNRLGEKKYNLVSNNYDRYYYRF